jgi:hypothetical protein
LNLGLLGLDLLRRQLLLHRLSYLLLLNPLLGRLLSDHWVLSLLRHLNLGYGVV